MPTRTSPEPEVRTPIAGLYFGLAFWVVVLVATICGFELAMVLYVAGERVLAAHNAGGEAFWIGHDAPVRNLLEELSFTAIVLAAVIGAVALYVADSQLRAFVRLSRDFGAQIGQAEAARTASIYVEVSTKWDSQEIATARDALEQLEKDYVALPTAAQTPHIPSASHHIWHKINVDHDENAYDAFIVVASFIEDIGLLCQKQYVRIDDINDIIGSGLLYQIGLLLEQIRHERRTAPDLSRARSRYAFALWLYSELKPQKRFALDGFGADHHRGAS
jgi:hypothetical protein